MDGCRAVGYDDGMKAAIVVLAGALLLFSRDVADAQQSSGSAAPPAWTPVDNCQAANALGPQVYSDVANDNPNALQELQLLVSALKMCQGASQGSVAQRQSGEVIPDNGPTDSNDSSDSNASGGGGVVNNILQTLQTVEQMYLQYRNAMSGNGTSSGSSNGPSYSGGSSYGYSPSSGTTYSTPSYAQSSYAQPSYAYMRPTYAYNRPSYASRRQSYSYGRPSYARYQAWRHAASALRWFR